MSESIPDNFESELEVNSGENGLDGSEISFVIGQSVELPTMDESKRPIIGYEYVDHTADIQLHAWAPKLQDAFIQCAYAMFAYMTDLDTVDIASSVELQAEATGDGLDSLLYHFLDELLFHFSAEYFVPKTIEITKFDREALKIDVTISGEDFELSKHPQGTEVKAITYSNLQIHEKENMCDVFVIVDI
ncbi:protein archease-like [Convolutriloba macropyga]|uniref:protein archease-like n=1 Tax=Convolutriloba macropyga TaxID=536237 RepID=UPI003F51B8E8